MRRHVVPLSLIVLVVACGAVSGPRRASSDVLTIEEIRTANASSAYDVIEQLRPQYLRSRGSISIQDPRPAYPVVYVDQMRYGELEALRMISVEQIAEIRYIGATDATTRWGTGHAAGVIQIISHLGGSR